MRLQLGLHPRSSAMVWIAALAPGVLGLDGIFTQALAHGVAAGDKGYIQETSGVVFFPFVYLGAKHMITGYDHLLFLFGVIFFLYRMKDVGIYVTMFAVGHSLTLLLGVLTGVSVSSYLIDAIIGLSVVYKALDNLGAYQRWFGFQPNTKPATLIFGLFHGVGLATKLQDFELSRDGLLATLSPSTSASRSARSSPWRASSSSWVSGGRPPASGGTPTRPTSCS